MSIRDEVASVLLEHYSRTDGLDVSAEEAADALIEKFPWMKEHDVEWGYYQRKADRPFDQDWDYVQRVTGPTEGYDNVKRFVTAWEEAE